MRAAVMEAPNQLVVRDLPDPEPGDYEALCVLLYGSICAGTDQHLVAGHEPFRSWFEYPAVLGHESIGEVVRVGPKVRHLSVGDRVTRVGTPGVDGVHAAWGGFAERGIATDWRAMRDDGLPEAQWQAMRVQQVLPADIDPAEATMMITWRETLSYIKRAGCGAGDRVVIVGSGGNGLAFASHARNLGAAAVVVVGSPLRKAAADELGATLVDYREPELASTLQDVCGDGVDLAIDAVGKAGALDPVLPRLKADATVAVYGLDEVEAYRFNPMLAPGSFRFYQGGYDEAETHDEVVCFMQSGELQARTFLSNLDQPFELSQIEAALDAVRTRRCIKSLVRLGGR